MSEGSVLSDFDAWQSEKLWPALSRSFSTGAVDNSKDAFDIRQFSSIMAKERSHTFHCKITRIVALTSSEDRLKYHMELNLPEDIVYQVGDYLEIVPKNSAEDVDYLMGIVQAHGNDLTDPIIPVMCSHLELRQQVSLKVGGCALTLHRNLPLYPQEILLSHVAQASFVFSKSMD